MKSAWRRRTSSDGAEARRPTTVAPANTATARITPKASSTVRSADRTLDPLATLCPATRSVLPVRTSSKRKVDEPTRTVTGAVSQWRAGSVGEAGVTGVTAPDRAIDQR